MTYNEKFAIYLEIDRQLKREDVLRWCEGEDIALTDDEMEDVLDTLEDEWDCENSYWGNIEYAVNTVVRSRK